MFEIQQGKFHLTLLHNYSSVIQGKTMLFCKVISKRAFAFTDLNIFMREKLQG